MFQIRYLCAELWQYWKLTALHINVFTVRYKNVPLLSIPLPFLQRYLPIFLPVEIEINSTVYLLDDIITVLHSMTRNATVAELPTV